MEMMLIFKIRNIRMWIHFTAFSAKGTKWNLEKRQTNNNASCNVLFGNLSLYLSNSLFIYWLRFVLLYEYSS